MRQFFLTYQKRQTVSSEFKLSWSHYIFLTRIENIDEQNFYEIESVENNWSLRELKDSFQLSDGTITIENPLNKVNKKDIRN